MLHPRPSGVCTATALMIALAWLPRARPADRPDGPQPLSPADWPMYNHDVGGWRFNPNTVELRADVQQSPTMN